MLQCRRCHSRKLVALSKKSPQDNDVFRCQECSFLFSPASVASGPPKNTAPPEPAKSPAPHTTGETPREPGTLVQPRKPSGVSKIIAPPALSPLDFAADVLGVELWSKQKEVLAALPQHRRVAVKSGNGLGKGFCAGVAVLWFLYSNDPAVVLSTAPTFRQVRHVLWRQVRQLYFRSKQPLGGKILDTRWELSEERYAMGLSADTADQFQGFHNANMFIVVDEAEGVSDEIYEAVESVMTSAETSRLLLIGNPTTVSGAFRRAFHEERNLYHTITISALDSPNVAAGKILVPGLTTAQWVQERRKTWGEDNPLFRARVLGEFPEQADDTLIKLSDIEAAANGELAAQDRPKGVSGPVQED